MRPNICESALTFRTTANETKMNNNRSPIQVFAARPCVRHKHLQTDFSLGQTIAYMHAVIFALDRRLQSHNMETNAECIRVWCAERNECPRSVCSADTPTHALIESTNKASNATARPRSRSLLLFVFVLNVFVPSRSHSWRRQAGPFGTRSTLGQSRIHNTRNANEK